MAAGTSVTLVGNLTDDPELRFTPSGIPVAKFTIAVNRRQQSQSGQWEDKLEGFFRCTAWREMAENVAELKKGTRVIALGRLEENRWEGQDGSKNTRVEIQVDEVGPSVRWARAEVTKSQRSFGAQKGQGQGGGASYTPAGGESVGDWNTAQVGAPGQEEGSV